MRLVVGVILVLLASVAADARPTRVPPPPDQILDLQPKPQPPVAAANWDGDAYPNTWDCNDDNPAVYPGAPEIANGIDDDCDGVIDAGFDTSADWPAVKVAQALGTDDLASIDAMPRVVWAGETFSIVWHDLADQVRFARIDPEGKLLDEKALVLAAKGRAPDLAWTGQHLGIVYQDTSEATASVRLLIAGGDGSERANVLVSDLGDEPRIVWAQDRFGVVWRVPYCAGDCLRFQRFDLLGRTIGPIEILENSGRAAAIAFSETGIQIDATGSERHDGSFGIAYEAYYGFAATADVILAVLPLEPFYAAPRYEKVNLHADTYNALGSRPSIAASPAGFAVSWHVFEGGLEQGHLRLIPEDGIDQPVQEFVPDAHAGRSSSILWTGTEFVMVNDNVATAPAGYEVHFRRLDASCNTHLSAGWGPWQEINLGAWTPGQVSVHPHIARSNGFFGIVWIEIEQEPASPGKGRIWFASVTHR